MEKQGEPINIIILPDSSAAETAINLSQSVSKDISTEFTLDGVNFIPHITIYQAHFPSKNIEIILEILKNVAETSSLLSIEMEEFYISPGRFVWWNSKKSDKIMNFHNQVLELVNPLREGLIAPEALSQLEELGERERQNVIKTGAIVHGELYVPHITITRIKNNEDREKTLEILGERKDVSFEANKLVVGRLSQHGTVTDILHEFPFGKLKKT